MKLGIIYLNLAPFKNSLFSKLIDENLMINDKFVYTIERDLHIKKKQFLKGFRMT